MREGPVLAWGEGTAPNGVSGSLWEAGVGIPTPVSPLLPGHSLDLKPLAMWFTPQPFVRSPTGSPGGEGQEGGQRVHWNKWRGRPSLGGGQGLGLAEEPKSPVTWACQGPQLPGSPAPPAPGCSDPHPIILSLPTSPPYTLP